jgi:hypothetical protein
MSKQPTPQPPADPENGTSTDASTPVVPGEPVDTENPNDEIEAYHEKLRKQLHDE